jgi:hypothetical protein
MILSGVVASSAGGFLATGGNQVLTQNGWNYHLFTSSGTFTVVSGASTLQVLTINGGQAGGSGSVNQNFGQPATGGNGGNGGSATFGPTLSEVSTSFAVTVGAAGGTSSVAPSRSTTTINGGVGGSGGQVRFDGEYGTPGSTSSASSGSSVSLYNTRGVPWSLLTLNQAANAGGGGGGAFGQDFGFGSSRSVDGASGGTSGFSLSQNGPSGGSPGGLFGSDGQANSGAGGGGNAVRKATSYGSFQFDTVVSSSLGGSGFVIVAYPVG